MLNISEQWTNLQTQITGRLNTLAEETILKHHITQFTLFCENVEKCVGNQQNGPGEAKTIELLSRRWEKLDNIASQYLKDRSKATQLEEFNTWAYGYYSRLCRALPESIGGLSAPLFFFADPSTDFAELTLFRERFPALLAIPENSRSKSVIAYELARAFFEQAPGFLPELRSRIQSQLPDLPETIVEWLGDIAARMTSIALLFDLAKMQEHLFIPAKPDISQSVTHSVALVLPYIGLETLQHILNYFLEDEKAEVQKSDNRIEQIEKELDDLLANRLNKPSEFISDSTDVSLQEAKDTLLSVVSLLCSAEMTLETLGGKSLFEVLIACAEDTSENSNVVLSNWGVISDETCQQFVIDLPDLLRPACVLSLPFSCRSVFFMSPIVPSFTLIDILKEIFD